MTGTWRDGNNGHWALWQGRKVVATISRLGDRAYRWTVGQQEGTARSKRAAQSAIGRCLRRLAERIASGWRCAHCLRMPPVVKVPPRHSLCCIACIEYLKSRGLRWCAGCKTAHSADQFRTSGAWCYAYELGRKRSYSGAALAQRRAQDRAAQALRRALNPEKYRAQSRAACRAYRQRQKLKTWRGQL